MRQRMPFKLFVGLVSIGCLLLLTVTACAAPSGPGAQSSEAPKGPSGKAVVALSPQTTATVDPALNGGASDFINLEALYNRLFETPKDSLKLEPGLATKWIMGPDGKTFEFQIRKGVKFHNGDEMTPEDVVFSVQRMGRIGLPTTKASYERFVDRVEAKGESVIFYLKEPNWNYHSDAAGYSIVPKNYIEKVGDDGFLKAPVGTGPFKFVSWSKQEYLELEAVDYQHFLWEPGVKQLRYVIVPEETTRLAMIRTGEADLAQISVTSLKAMAGDGKLRAIKIPDIGGLWLYTFGQHDPQNPLSKLQVRQALSLSIDREAIAKGIYQGYARPIATGVWNSAQEGWPEWGFDAPKLDLEKAKTLLDQAGYPGGQGLKITLHNYEYGALPLWTQVAPVIATQWGKLGVKVELRQWTWDSWAPAARSGKLDPVSIGTHIGYLSGQKGLVNWFTTTGSYAHAFGVAKEEGAHKELSEMAEQFDRELNPTKRAELLNKIQIYIRDNVVNIPVVGQDGLWAGGPRLLEYTPRPGTITSGNVWTIKVKG